MEIWSKHRHVLGKGNANEDVQVEVRKVLGKFQDGYSKRDVNLINAYMEELFSKEGDALIVGTADAEWCLGLDAMKEIVECDWKYWGNLILDVDGAVISSHGDVAWLTTEGTVNSLSSEDKMYNKYVERIKDSFTNDVSSKDKLIDALKSISICLYETNLGEDVVRPIRFSAILIKDEGKWKFHNIHFSHPTTLPADVRIIGDNKIS